MHYILTLFILITPLAFASHERHINVKKESVNNLKRPLDKYLQTEERPTLVVGAGHLQAAQMPLKKGEGQIFKANENPFYINLDPTKIPDMEGNFDTNFVKNSMKGAEGKFYKIYLDYLEFDPFDSEILAAAHYLLAEGGKIYIPFRYDKIPIVDTSPLSREDMELFKKENRYLDRIIVGQKPPEILVARYREFINVYYCVAYGAERLIDNGFKNIAFKTKLKSIWPKHQDNIQYDFDTGQFRPHFIGEKGKSDLKERQKIFKITPKLTRDSVMTAMRLAVESYRKIIKHPLDHQGYSSLATSPQESKEQHRDTDGISNEDLVYARQTYDEIFNKIRTSSVLQKIIMVNLMEKDEFKHDHIGIRRTAQFYEDALISHYLGLF